MPSSTVVPAAGDEEDVSVAVVAHTPGATPIVDDDDATDVENAIDDLTDLTDDEQGAAEWDGDDPEDINMAGLTDLLTHKPSMCQRLCCLCNCCCCSKGGAVPPSKAFCSARPVRGVLSCIRRTLHRVDEIIVDIIYGSIRMKAELAFSWLVFKAQSMRNALPQWWEDVWHPHFGIPARFRACRSGCWNCLVYCVQACKNWRRESSYRHGSGSW